MKVPQESALLERAKALVVAMHAVERWAYAIDASVPGATLRAAIEREGYAVTEEDVEAKVVRYEARAPGEEPGEGGKADSIVTLERADLALTLLRAEGPTTPDRLGPILEATGFVPQSRLLRVAYDPASPEAPRALTALAHMVVTWDADWGDLFLLHLASPDPVVRHEGVLSTVIAALGAHEREPARTLLAEAHRHESFPQLKKTLEDAIRAVGSLGAGTAP